ncbi:type II secretion system F family protein [Methylovulum psychrotolerans]|uniref:Type II secretion system protein GspF domain-containing protein n=1 Tax=Methylovulum psychrotolerans TaxID=1704499 RepID=A0A1Z4C3D2_9GAMM|nr:type II secretion system F family protein [Methylovulum psychrotolerans]ASF48028.1 hypothetical protein CEK71_19230 [Methylovulum psychrotolerans]
MPKKITLTLDQQAQLFQQLAHLEQAGLPAAEAFALVGKNTPLLRKALNTLPTRLRSGQKISEAGFRAGLFDDNQRLVLAAAEQGGCLAAVYAKLAAYYAATARRRKQMLSRLYLPAAVLVISLFVQPLPDLVAARISAADYLAQSAGTLAMLAVGIGALLKLPTVLVALGVSGAWHSLQLRLPPVAAWLTARQLNRCYFLLALLLEAGLPYSQALPQAVAAIPNTRLRAQFRPALALLPTGASVSETLAAVSLVKPATWQIINTGEYSGQLAETLQHFTELDAQTLALQDEALAEWLPRLVYTAIGLWMAYGILARGLPLPPVLA